MAAAMNFGKLFLGAIVIKYYNNNNETDEAVKLLKRLKYFFKSCKLYIIRVVGASRLFRIFFANYLTTF